MCVFVCVPVCLHVSEHFMSALCVFVQVCHVWVAGYVFWVYVAGIWCDCVCVRVCMFLYAEQQYWICFLLHHSASKFTRCYNGHSRFLCSTNGREVGFHCLCS